MRNARSKQRRVGLYKRRSDKKKKKEVNEKDISLINDMCGGYTYREGISIAIRSVIF